MSRQLSIPESIIRSFLNRYDRTQTLTVPRGRPNTITNEIKEAIVNSVESNAGQTLHQLSKNFNVSEFSVRSILNANSFTCQGKIPVPQLIQMHKNARISFCNRYTAILYQYMPTIIFTD